jgi:hypothetical protein
MLTKTHNQQMHKFQEKGKMDEGEKLDLLEICCVYSSHLDTFMV